MTDQSVYELINLEKRDLRHKKVREIKVLIKFCKNETKLSWSGELIKIISGYHTNKFKSLNQNISTIKEDI